MAERVEQLPDAISVLLVEDDPATRAALEAVVGSLPGHVLVASAGSFSAGNRALTEVTFDLALVDLDLPDGSGLDLIRRIKALDGTKVLVITVFADQTNVLAATRAGADGYVLKDIEGPELESAIQQVMTGAAPLSPAVAAHLLRQVRSGMRKVAGESLVNALTERETDVLEQLARGHTYREVGRRCGISHNTVAFHVKQIYDKLQVNSRGEAIYRAVNDGIISM